MTSRLKLTAFVALVLVALAVVVIASGSTFEQFGPFEGSGAESLVVGNSAVVTDRTENQPCPAGHAGETYDLEDDSVSRVSPTVE